MRISIFIACLALLYGTCTIYAEESVNLIEKATHDISKRQTATLTEPVLRQKRSVTMSSLHGTRSSTPLEMGLNMLGLGGNVFIRPVLDLCTFVYNILLGEALCPKMEKLPTDWEKMMLHPIQTIENMFCYFFDAIGNQGRAMMRAMIPYLSKFVFTVVLPGMHTIMNRIAQTGILPPSVEAIIGMFNTLYMILHMFGYIP